MVNWRTLKIGDRLTLKTTEIMQKIVVPCTVTEIYNDHIILLADGGYNMWLDDDFAEIFFRRRE